jgi:DNA-binding transcriptional MerR regulator
MSKLYYSISEVAEMLDVNQSLLRFWEKEFDSFIKPHKNAKGTRFYKTEDIDLIKQIHFLVKIQGLTLSGAKQKLKQNKDGIAKTHEVFTRLCVVKDELLALRKGITLPGETETE